MNAHSRPRAIGVDGATGGWVSATISADSHLEITFVDAFAEIVSSASVDDVIIVDMPIGLSSDGYRPVDALVRERLGFRRSTFFPTPLRAVLDFESWDEANAHSKEVSGKGLSKQAWNLVPKIAEVDNCWTSALRGRLREGHPETSFAEMSGAPLSTKKADVDGRAERTALLHVALGADITRAIAECPKRWSTDAVDALALAWTGLRVHAGHAIHLGGEPDECGRPMELCI